jgi:hypothetical protein
MATALTIAAVCKRGHVISINSMPWHRGRFCDECGATIIRSCEACDEYIPGVPAEPNPFGELETEGWERPSFCGGCGTAFPWVDRQGRIYELENMLRHEALPEATLLAIREELEALAESDLSEKEQVKRWKRVRELSPQLWERGGPVIQDLATEWMKRKLGL